MNITLPYAVYANAMDRIAAVLTSSYKPDRGQLDETPGLDWVKMTVTKRDITWQTAVEPEQPSDTEKEKYGHSGSTVFVCRHRVAVGANIKVHQTGVCCFRPVVLFGLVRKFHASDVNIVLVDMPQAGAPTGAIGEVRFVFGGLGRTKWEFTTPAYRVHEFPSFEFGAGTAILRIDRDTLVRAVASVSPVVPHTDHIDLINNICLRRTGGRVFVLGTDGKRAALRELHTGWAEGSEKADIESTILLRRNAVVNALSNLKSSTVIVARHGEWYTVDGGGTTYGIRAHGRKIVSKYRRLENALTMPASRTTLVEREGLLGALAAAVVVVRSNEQRAYAELKYTPGEGSMAVSATNDDTTCRLVRSVGCLPVAGGTGMAFTFHPDHVFQMAKRLAGDWIRIHVTDHGRYMRLSSPDDPAYTLVFLRMVVPGVPTSTGPVANSGSGAPPPPRTCAEPTCTRAKPGPDPKTNGTKNMTVNKNNNEEVRT
jgi:DNA polymerase III sliding clamp (beta) subunit (PCNA family)